MGKLTGLTKDLKGQRLEVSQRCLSARTEKFSELINVNALITYAVVLLKH